MKLGRTDRQGRTRVVTRDRSARWSGCPRPEGPSMHRRTLALLGAAAVAVSVAGAPSHATARSATQPLRYVALGDSYSAASGVLPPDPTSRSCARSTAN